MSGIILRVDFYQLSRDPVEVALCAVARSSLKIGSRLLVVVADEALRVRISQTLWAHIPDSFLANGLAGGPHDARQPILISHSMEAANGAAFLVLADGIWRESDTAFARVFYFFNEATLQIARETWRMLGGRDDVERKFWIQDGGKWREGP
jgi:DNA polymerase-3 subunit chi